MAKEQTQKLKKLNFISLDSAKKPSTLKKDAGLEPENSIEHEQLKSLNHIENTQALETEPAFHLPNIFKSLSLPGFLNTPREDQTEILSLEGPDKNFNPNSLSSIFAKDRNEASGISRVFRKSISFLVLQLVAFLFLTIISLNFFQNFFVNLIILIFAISLTNIFYIIVADRSYVWLGLLGQICIVILAHSFLGLGFNPITLVLTLLSLLFSFLAYSELEKIQLSSRLFSISYITTESTRILLTGATFLVALGVFNSIIFEGSKDGDDLGSKPFLDRVVFSNQLFVDFALIGQSKSISVNRFLVSGGFYKDSANRIVFESSSKDNVVIKQATFGDFLTQNYEFNEVLSKNELDDFQNLNCKEVGVKSEACNLKIQEETNKRLLEWKSKAYSNLNYDLTTPLTVNNYREITKTFYLNKIGEFESEKSENTSFIDSSLLLVPVKTIIPAIFAIAVVSLMFIFRFALAWLIFLATWIIWKTLLWTGFAQIDVETVEAEIVSV